MFSTGSRESSIGEMASSRRQRLNRFRFAAIEGKPMAKGTSLADRVFTEMRRLERRLQLRITGPSFATERTGAEGGGRGREEIAWEFLVNGYQPS